MGRRASQQATYTKGELDPDLSERQDLEHYYDSLARATNCIFHPQGGFSDRGGFELISDADVLASGALRRLRERITPYPLTAGMITAANGGVAANLVDSNVSTFFQTNTVTSSSFELFQVDLGAASRVDFVDLNNFNSELLGADEALAVQYFDGAVWQTFGDAPGMPQAKGIRTVAAGGQRYRRFGVSPGGPGGVPVVAQYWRVVALNAVGIGYVRIGGLMLWREVPGLTPIRMRALARDADEAYELVFTERNVDVFRKQRYVASMSIGVAAQQIPQLNFAGGIDRMMVFHEDVWSISIVRQGSPSEWNAAPHVYTAVPQLATGAAFSASQDEIQDVDLSGLVAGDEFAVFLGEYYAGQIAFTSASALPGQILTVLGGIGGLTAGAANIVTSLLTGQVVRVRFAGANANRAWPVVTIIPLDAANVQPATSVVQAGLFLTGSFFEVRNGWPRAGAFVQQRLLVGGFRAAPTSYRFSYLGSINNFAHTASPMTADLGFGGALEVDDVEIIYDIFEGRHLQMFTQTGEFWAPAGALSATAPIAFSRATAQGKQRGVPMLFVDGASLFVQQGGDTLREFIYLEAEQSYQAEPLSVLCPHVLADIRDCAHRPARRVSDGNVLLFVNGDGSAAAITTLRKQSVIAGAPWTTDGAFLAAICGLDFEVRCVIERSGHRYLERWTPGLPLDHATHVVSSSPISTITGAAHLNGREDVWAIADGEVFGPLAVAGGALTLPIAASDIRYGLLPPWFVRGQIPRGKLQGGQPFRAPGRIYEVELALKATGSLRLGTNGQPHADVPLLFTGDALTNAGPLAAGGEPQYALYDRLFTGAVTVEGLLGISETPFFELSRAVPAPVHVKAIRYEISDKGD